LPWEVASTADNVRLLCRVHNDLAARGVRRRVDEPVHARAAQAHLRSPVLRAAD